jgi:hypothetical protein
MSIGLQKFKAVAEESVQRQLMGSSKKLHPDLQSATRSCPTCGVPLGFSNLCPNPKCARTRKALANLKSKGGLNGPLDHSAPAQQARGQGEVNRTYPGSYVDEVLSSYSRYRKGTHPVMTRSVTVLESCASRTWSVGFKVQGLHLKTSTLLFSHRLSRHPTSQYLDSSGRKRNGVLAETQRKKGKVVWLPCIRYGVKVMGVPSTPILTCRGLARQRHPA